MPTLLAAHRNSVITCVICYWKNPMCNPYRHQSQCVAIFMARLAHSELSKSLVCSQNWYCRPVYNLSMTQPNHSAARFWCGRWLHCGWLRLVGKTLLDIRVDSLSMEFRISHVQLMKPHVVWDTCSLMGTRTQFSTTNCVYTSVLCLVVAIGVLHVLSLGSPLVGRHHFCLLLLVDRCPH